MLMMLAPHSGEIYIIGCRRVVVSLLLFVALGGGSGGSSGSCGSSGSFGISL